MNLIYWLSIPILPTYPVSHHSGITVLIQISTVIEVAKKVKESMSMFSGDSCSKDNLINLLLDDPYMIYVSTNEKIIELFSNKHQPHKGPQPRKGRGWTEEDRLRISYRIKDVWDENYADFEACDGMPGNGTKELNWKESQLKSGRKSLDDKIKKEIKQIMDAPCGGIGKRDFWIASHTHTKCYAQQRKWEENYADYEAYDGMPEKGTKELSWKENQLCSGPAGLNAKIEK